MKSSLTEDAIEQYNLQLLQNLGYAYHHGYELQPEGKYQERESFGDVVLKARLTQAIDRLNPTIPPDARHQAQREIFNIASPDLLNNNETFHKYLKVGITVEYQKDGETRGEQAWLIDWNHPENNEFLAVNEFTVIEDNHNRRPDIVLFINGLPLVVIELKNAADEKANLRAAYNQLQTYKREIPSLFSYNGLLIISDGLSARAGSLSADFNRFLTWKTGEADINELEILTNGLLNKQTLLDLIRSFTVFEKSKTEDLRTNIVSISSEKKIAAYHQYYAVNKAVESIIRAAGFPSPSPLRDGFRVKERLEMYNPSPNASQIDRLSPFTTGRVTRVESKSPEGTIGDRKGGVLWHTQGSGKSLSMVFLAGKLVLNPNLNNPTIVMLTDRNDLDDQLFDTFAGCKQLLRQDPLQAEERAQVRELLNVNSGGIIFTTVQKFAPTENETLYPKISDRANIIVLADEAHRSQYGFKAKQVNILDEAGNIIGKRTKYGFAKYIRDALPNATFVGFTGTPVEQTDKNTPAIFGEYIDIYDIAQAVKDGATVPIYYESRLVQVDLDETGRQLLDELDEDLSYEDLSTTQKAKAEQTKIEAIVGSTKRLEQIAQDIVTHFEAGQTRDKTMPSFELQ